MFSDRFYRATLLFVAASVLVLSGCSKSNSPTSSGGSGSSISGFVKDADGEPVAGVSVMASGQSPVITQSDGSFSIPGVPSPYDLTLILSTQSTALVYKGLTRNDPVLYYPQSLTQNKTATITGTVPVESQTSTGVCFVSGDQAWQTLASNSTGHYSIDVEWKGSASSLGGKLYVLRWASNSSTGLPSQYDGYASADLTVSAGGSFGHNDFATTDLTDPAEQSISGTIQLPSSGYKLTEKDLLVDFGNAYVYLGYEYGSSVTTGFSYTVPVIDGVTFEIDAYANASSTPTNRECYFWKTGIPAGSSGLNVPLYSAPQLSLPAHNGTGIDTTTEFLWAAGGGGGINVVEIYPFSSGAGPTYYVFTAENSATIPNLASQGLGLPANTLYSWGVTQYYPMSSIDSVASDEFVAFENGTVGDRGAGESEIFNFTTKATGKSSPAVRQPSASRFLPYGNRTGSLMPRQKASSFFEAGRFGSKALAR